MRWKIEIFHKILKSGCRAEDSRLRTADRLTDLIAIYCILSWRIFWPTMLNRADPRTCASEVFTETEIAVLDRLSPKTGRPSSCLGCCRTAPLSWQSSGDARPKGGERTVLLRWDV